jgi:hypothetical protein
MYMLHFTVLLSDVCFSPLISGAHTQKANGYVRIENAITNQLSHIQ